MENTAILLIAVTLFLLVIIVGLLTLLVFKILKQTANPSSLPQSDRTTTDTPHPDLSKNQFHPTILERIKELEKVKPRKTELFCPNHVDEPGEVSCAICDHLFCKACIKPFKNLYFCKEHMPLIMQNDWDEVLTIKTSTKDPEQGVRLYEIKKEIFQQDDVPTYIETHYKINVDQDYIETYLVLFGIKENIPKLKEKLSSFL